VPWTVLEQTTVRGDAHAHHMDVFAEEPHDRRARGGGVVSGDGACERGGVFDVAQRRGYGRAVELLPVDAFADVSERFHARLRGRAGAGDRGGGGEQHDAQSDRRT
jgi:hypothetical protein